MEKKDARIIIALLTVAIIMLGVIIRFEIKNHEHESKIIWHQGFTTGLNYTGESLDDLDVCYSQDSLLINE